ncbi:ribosome maturation factor RimM [Buchnera aphidicola]|uniref:Ribosome maturation factor RimM n=1 Tax=Buchnera aphidicola (Therioaphis trifolii) TaxID=1241884 RepID=A0A4D6YDH4_9GAMM|nr:ribosome maturation factor RimM [Buchnera aphidicola]QCI27259.1 ribosome maturation factor RimM [Buchnera aphidicola (Therioaphis trifolii)]
MKNLLIIGKIGAAYGILGWNKIFSYTEKKKNIFEYTPWLIHYNKKWKKFFIENKKINKKIIIVKFININNRNNAQLLTNHVIFIKKKQLPKLKKFEYYWYNLINCKVFNTKKQYLGKVNKIIRTKANDILVIKIQKTNKEYLIPFIINIFINKVDLKMKFIYLNI